MEYDHGKARGILDRTFTPVKLAFHKDCLSTTMLSKCRDCVWGEVSGNFQYFLADGTGAAVGCDSFEIDLADGSKETLPWTLSNYLKVSNIKYASRLRLYCVRKLSSMFIGNMLSCNSQYVLFLATEPPDVSEEVSIESGIFWLQHVSVILTLIYRCYS